MMHWLHPRERLNSGKQERFDPVVEGARHGLAPELSLAIWQRVSADSGNGGRADDPQQAQRRFHEIAARLAAGGLRLAPGIGKRTRAEVERDPDRSTADWAEAMKIRVPGRRTMVETEARRWRRIEGVPVDPVVEAPAVIPPDGAAEREPPGASDVAQVVAALGSATRPAQDRIPAAATSAQVNWLLGLESIPPRAGIRRIGEASDREAVQRLLDREGIVVEPVQLDGLARLYGPSTSWSLRPAATAWDALQRLIEHAGHHADPAPRHPRATAGPPTGGEEVLDDATREAIARTVGFDVGPVPIVRDPELVGRGGAAARGAIHLEPGLADDRHGREVRLHEAVHIAQTRVPGPVAEQELVEVEAAHVARAAERGERMAPQLRADQGRAYGFDLPGIDLPGIDLPSLSPIDLLRKLAPDVTRFIDQGFDGLLEHLGGAANHMFQDVLDGLGVNKFVDGFKSLTSAVGPGSMVFGVLTGCCECLDSALGKLDGKLDQFLASDGANKVKNAIGAAQESQKNQILDEGAGFFAFLQKFGGPVLGIIEGAASAIEWVKKKVGPLAKKVWELICHALGLDVSLPPLEAIKKKLGELWQKASAALAPLRDAIHGAVEWLKNQSPLAPLFKLAGDVKKLVDSVKKLLAAKARDAKTWLATLAKDLAGTVFEPLLGALMTGRAALLVAADAVAAWFNAVLGKLGLLEAWRTSIAFIQQIVATVQGFVHKVKAALAAIGQEIEKVLREIADACQKFYGAVKPLLDFVCGFAVAIAATMMGNLLALPLFFLGNLWLHVLPECYKEPIVDFCIKAFIKVVQWLPAKGLPIWSLLKSAMLAFLNQLLGTPRDRKMKAMNTVASLVAGNVEFTAGLVVGVFKGIYDSTIGTVVFIFETAIWLAQMGIEVAAFAGRSVADILGAGGLVDFMRDAGESTTGVDEVERDLAGGSRGDAKAQDVEDVEEDAPVELGPDELPDDTPDEDSDPGNVGDEPAVLSGTEEPSSDDADASSAADDGRIDPPPPIPEDLRSGRALFDAVFKHGVTRKDLEELLTTIGTGLEAAAKQAGAEAAKALIDALNRDGIAYQIGETVGRIIGMVAVEVALAVFTGGAGLGKTAVTLTKFAVKFAKNLPRLMKMVKWVLDAIRPALQALGRLKKGIGAWAGKLARYMDDLIEWGNKNIQKLVRAIKARIRGEKSPGRPGRPHDKRHKDGPDDDPPGRPRDKKKRDEDLKIAAMRGARAGWRRMDDLAGAVHPVSAPRTRLGSTMVRRVRGIRVDLSLTSLGSGWKVKAVASRRGRRATARSGEGWITRADNRSKWYAIKNEKRLHADIIEDAFAAMRRGYSQHGNESTTGKNQYQLLEKLTDEQKRLGQQRVTLRGVNVKSEMESYPSAEKDHDVTVEIIITPNRRSKKAQFPLHAGNKYDATAAPGSTRAAYDVEGPWAKIREYHGHQYPDPPIDTHPANAYLGAQEHPFFPDGRYHTRKGINSPGGMHHVEGWRTYLRGQLQSMKRLKLAELQKAEPDASEARLQVLQKEAEKAAREFLLEHYGRRYPGVKRWDELELKHDPAMGSSPSHGFNAHHIVPFNWGGPDAIRNICVLRQKRTTAFSSEHQPYTNFFESKVKPALLDAVYTSHVPPPTSGTR